MVTGLLESNKCMTWHLWGVNTWRFWNLMMRMERFQDCVGISNIANFCSTALWFDLMLWKAFSTPRSALAARIVQRREAGCAPCRTKTDCTSSGYFPKAELGFLVSSLKQGEIKYSDRLMAFLVTCWVSSINLSNSCQRNTGLQWKMFRMVLTHQ